jgi:hypothetical protein
MFDTSDDDVLRVSLRESEHDQTLLHIDGGDYTNFEQHSNGVEFRVQSARASLYFGAGWYSLLGWRQTLAHQTNSRFVKWDYD